MKAAFDKGYMPSQPELSDLKTLAPVFLLSRSAAFASKEPRLEVGFPFL